MTKQSEQDILLRAVYQSNMLSRGTITRLVSDGKGGVVFSPKETELSYQGFVFGITTAKKNPEVLKDVGEENQEVTNPPISLRQESARFVYQQWRFSYFPTMFRGEPRVRWEGLNDQQRKDWTDEYGSAPYISTVQVNHALTQYSIKRCTTVAGVDAIQYWDNTEGDWMPVRTPGAISDENALFLQVRDVLTIKWLMDKKLADQVKGPVIEASVNSAPLTKDTLNHLAEALSWEKFTQSNGRTRADAVALNRLAELFYVDWIRQQPAEVGGRLPWQELPEAAKRSIYNLLEVRPFVVGYGHATFGFGVYRFVSPTDYRLCGWLEKYDPIVQAWTRVTDTINTMRNMTYLEADALRNHLSLKLS